MRWKIVVLWSLALCVGLAAQSPQPPQPAKPAPPAAPSDAAPQPTQPRPTFRAGIDLLSLDVTVVDSEGRQVNDLKPSEFIVEVDGNARPVVTADYVKLVDETPQIVGARKPTPAPTRSPDEDFFSTNTRMLTPGRLILLLVDHGNIRAGQGRQVLRDALKFVDNLSPHDRVGLAAIPAPGALVDFTTEHEKIREGLLTIVGQAQPYRGRFNISLSEAIATAEHSDFTLTQQMILRECAAVLSIPAEAARCELEVEQECSEIAAHQRQQTQASVRSMLDIFKGLGGIDGPKSVVLISEGLVLEGLGSDIDLLASAAADVRASLDVLLLEPPAVDVAESRRPTTPREDRNLQMTGLESLAGVARGSLHRIVASADQAFARVLRSMAGHYLLGVESRPADRDGRRHRVQVKTTRRGVTLYSRRGFLAPTSPGASTPTDAVSRLLKAPLTMNELPMRLATWTYKEQGGSKVRLLIAAEVERAADQSLDYTTGLVLVDRNNRAVSTGVELKTFAVSPVDAARAIYSAAISVEPGTYLLRLALADSEGRMGSVERRLDAWQMNGPGLTMGDLLVGQVPDDPAGSLAAAIEPTVGNGRLAAVVEVYAPSVETLKNVQATLDVLPSENAKPVASTPMLIGKTAAADTATVQAQVNTATLPPGRYFARATITESGKPRGHFIRPFRVVAGATAPRAVDGMAVPTALPAEMVLALLSDLPAVDRQALLAPDVLSAVLTSIEKSRPSASKVLATARSGKLGPAALAALEAGDQPLAAFLRGVDFFAQGQADRAMQQLQISMQQAPSFAPARLYLGALLASANKDKEAASLLQSVPADVAGPAPVNRMAAISWLKAGNISLAIDSLEKAAAQAPADQDAARVLALAYVIGNRGSEAVPLLTKYLAAKPTDHAALLAGVYAIYVSHTPAPRGDTLAADRTRAQAWAKGYAAAGGKLTGIVQAWIKHLEGLK